MSKELEALECSLKLYKMVESAGNGNGFNLNEAWKYYKTIKQVLLKAQEPKHYLKWEDLEFTRDEKVMLVKMGDTVYKVLYRCCDGIKEVQLLSEDEKFLYFNYIGNFKDNIQFFNDLHLERVEE